MSLPIEVQAETIAEIRILIGVPDAHGDVFTHEVFTNWDSLCDSDAEVLRVRAQHAEDTAPISKVTRMTAHVDSHTTPNMGVLRQHIEFGHPVPDGDAVLMRFNNDHRPFTSMSDGYDICVDRANFDPDQYDAFVEHAAAIYPDAKLMTLGRKSAESEALLWIGKALESEAFL